jgi:hypothetical protein
MKQIWRASLMLTLAVALTACGGKEQAPEEVPLAAKSLRELYPGDMARADAIQVVDGGTGERKLYSDMQQVRLWIDSVQDIVLVPDPNQEDRNGYLYGVTLFEGEESRMSFTPNSAGGHYRIHNEELSARIEALFAEAPLEKRDNEHDGIEIKPENDQYGRRTTEIKFRIENNGSEEIAFGTDYAVETRSDGRWLPVPFKDSVAFPDIGIMLGAGDYYELTISSNQLKSTWKEGRYRLVKSFYRDGRPVTLASEFAITDS